MISFFKTRKLTFLNILIVSIFVHIITSYFSSGFHHYDEHFQIIEFLNYKLGGVSSKSLTWEYGQMMRPWIQVFIYFSITKLVTLLGITSPFKIVFILRLLTSLFGVFSFYKLLPLIKRWFPKYHHQTQVYLLLNLLWYIPFIQSRTSSESLSVSFFVLGFSNFVQLIESQKKSIKISFISGLLLGTSYLIRPQLALMVAPLWLWAFFIKKTHFKNLLVSALAIILIILIGVLFDYWGYGKWTFIAWNYYTGNFQTGVMANVKHYPWHYFFKLTFLRGIPPISLPLIIASLIGIFKYKKHPLTWSILPFYIFHSLIGHKELRYIFPVIVLIPFYLIFLIRDYSWIEEKMQIKNPGKFWYHFFFKFAIAINITMLIFMMFKPANPAVNFFEYLYNSKKVKTLYYFDGNPYHMLGRPLSFYVRKDLKLSPKTNFKQLYKEKNHTFYVFFDKSFRIFDMKKYKKCSLIYLTYPSWVLKLNIGNWIKRSRIWSMYKCK